jgi:CDP-glucose 4,6-dehydratase
MEDVVSAAAEIAAARGLPDAKFWRGRRVLVTGHTGFIGGWLCAWLSALDCKVSGMALAPPSRPSFYGLAGLGGRIYERIADIRSDADLVRVFSETRPEIVFHLAAQPIVREAYDRPVATFDVNLMGTVHVLEQSRRHAPQAVVVITSDKVYAAGQDRRRHVEQDRLGPSDPYGSSKACCELAIQAFGGSFLEPSGIGIASVRAGNVIGGGDWGPGRLVPDAVRALSSGQPLAIRRPGAVRPWQHVLDAVNGLLLAAEQAAEQRRAMGAWNIGPMSDRPLGVGSLLRLVASAWQGDAQVTVHPEPDFAEAEYLAIDSSRARRDLDLRSPWGIERTVAETVAWYKQALAGADAWALTQTQIAGYSSARRQNQFADADG